MGREDRITDEAAALWRELYGEPPPIKADGAMMLGIITRSLPEKGYDRISSHHLRPTEIVMPRQASA